MTIRASRIAPGSAVNHPANNDELSELLGPGTPAYRVLSDAGTMVYFGMAAMVLGSMQPQVGQALADHEPLINGSLDKPGTEHAIRRVLDSYELVAGIVLGVTPRDRAEAATTLRELHRTVQGTMADGSRYHAWEREIWAYAWTGIFKGVMDAYAFSRGFRSDAEREQALAGAVKLGELFGVQGVPDTWDEFSDYWTNYMTQRAQTNASVDFIMEQLGPRLIKPSRAQWIPQPVWAVISLPLRRLLRIGALATFPTVLDQRLGLRRTRLDRLELAAHRILWRLVPKALSERDGPALFRIRQHLGPTPPWQNKYSPEKLARRRRDLDHARPDGAATGGSAPSDACLGGMRCPST